MKKLLTLILGAFLAPAGAMAQTTHMEGVIAPFLYPPEIIRQVQDRLDLSEDQEAQIRTLTVEFQASLAEVEWDLGDRVQALVPLVSGERVDVAETLGAFEEVLALEARIKKRHLKLLMDIKNLLTPDQIQTMKEEMESRIRRAGGQSHRGGGEPGALELLHF